VIGSGRSDLSHAWNRLKRDTLTKTAVGIKTRKAMHIPDQYCFQVIGYLPRNHFCRNGSQLIKAAFAEAFLLASRISNLILQASEEQLQACIGMTEWAIYARSSATEINVLTNKPAEKEGQSHTEGI